MYKQEEFGRLYRRQKHTWVTVLFLKCRM